MKKILQTKLLFALFFGVLTFFSSCRKEDFENEEPVPEVKKLQIMGNVEIPDNIPSNKIGTLEILSGTSNHLVSSTPPTLNSKTTTKYCIVETQPNTIQIHSITNNEQPFMYGYSLNAKAGDEIKFNVESTAVTLLLMSPYLLVPEPLEAQALIDKIKLAPTFNEFKNSIGDILISGSLNNQSPNIDLNTIPKYKIVVTEVLHSLNPNYNITQNGMQIIENSKVGNELKFKIRNYKKRYSTVYAEKYKNGQLVDTNIKIENGNYETHQLIDSGEFDWIKAWKQIFTLNLQDQITKDSEYFFVNAEDADKIFIKCYGLGLKNGSFPSISSKEYKRGLEAVVHTAVFDIIKPAMSMVEGFKEWGSLADLRGRPNDDPTKKLILKFLSSLENDSGFYNDIATAAINNDKKEIYKIYYNKTIEFILDDSNAKLYLDIMKKNSSDEKIVNAFKKSLKAFFKVKAAGEITGTAVNLGEAVAATFTTEWTTEFIMNTDGTASLTDTFNNNYKTVNLGNRWWSAENWKGTFNGTQDFAGWYGSNTISNLYSLAYGDYISGKMIRDNIAGVKIPQGWNLPTKDDFDNLVSGLGTSAFQTLTNQAGFNAKPYGYIYFQGYFGGASSNYPDLNNKAIFASRTTFVNAQSKTYVYCLVINHNTQTVTVEPYEIDFYSPSGYGWIESYFNLRVIKS